MAASASFGVAGVAGLALAVVVAPWLIAVGAACIAAAWLYIGRSPALRLRGLGEVFVFVFFGVVAVTGTAYVQYGHVSALALIAAIPVGLLATALLVVNNLRDIDTDRRAGKNTLAVRTGAVVTRSVLRRLRARCLRAGGRRRAVSARWL